MESLEALLRRQTGVVTWGQARGHLSAAAVRHRIDSGRWRRTHRGVFVTHTGPLTPAQRAWVAVLAAGGDRAPGRVCLGGLSALVGWGLRSIDTDVVHVLVPAQWRVVVPPDVSIHRCRIPPERTGGMRLRPPATMPGRSVVDAAAWARSDEQARLIVAASFQQRLVGIADITGAVAMMPKARRRALVLRTAADCAGGSHSLGELDLLALCRRFRLPMPTRQAPRRDRQGRRRYLDAVFDPWRVAVEVDGAHHADVGQMWDDAERANSLELDGYTVLRYPTFVVRTRPARVAADLRAALRARGWRS